MWATAWTARWKAVAALWAVAENLVVLHAGEGMPDTGPDPAMFGVVLLTGRQGSPGAFAVRWRFAGRGGAGGDCGCPRSLCCGVESSSLNVDDVGDAKFPNLSSSEGAALGRRVVPDVWRLMGVCSLVSLDRTCGLGLAWCCRAGLVCA